MNMHPYCSTFLETKQQQKQKKVSSKLFNSHLHLILTRYSIQHFVTKERDVMTQRTLDHYEFNHIRTRKRPAETETGRERTKIEGKQGYRGYNYMQH
jgi:hypothetical protein